MYLRIYIYDVCKYKYIIRIQHRNESSELLFPPQKYLFVCSFVITYSMGYRYIVISMVLVCSLCKRTYNRLYTTGNGIKTKTVLCCVMFGYSFSKGKMLCSNLTCIFSTNYYTYMFIYLFPYDCNHTLM